MVKFAYLISKVAKSNKQGFPNSGMRWGGGGIGNFTGGGGGGGGGRVVWGGGGGGLPGKGNLSRSDFDD